MAYMAVDRILNDSTGNHSAGPLNALDASDPLFHVCWRRQPCSYCLAGDVACSWCAIVGYTVEILWSICVDLISSPLATIQPLSLLPYDLPFSPCFTSQFLAFLWCFITLPSSQFPAVSNMSSHQIRTHSKNHHNPLSYVLLICTANLTCLPVINLHPKPIPSPHPRPAPLTPDLPTRLQGEMGAKGPVVRV